MLLLVDSTTALLVEAFFLKQIDALQKTAAEKSHQKAPPRENLDQKQEKSHSCKAVNLLQSLHIKSLLCNATKPF
jgi:hypothetical protein